MPRLEGRPARRLSDPLPKSQGSGGVGGPLQHAQGLSGGQTPLLGLPSDLPGGTYVAVDVEVSEVQGTLSVVNMAWRDRDGVIRERSYPFDQKWDEGKKAGSKKAQAERIKREKNQKERAGQVSMFGADDLAGAEDDRNLGEPEWNELLDWLSRQWLEFHNAEIDLYHLRKGVRQWPGRNLGTALKWDTLAVCLAACEPIWSGESIPRDVITARPANNAELTLELGEEQRAGATRADRRSRQGGSVLR